ncbi:hypothetical protein B0H12DRAFT_1031580 [Mycena haematopus]|nr:hypothetical protein B0H12DRAFT_1031580 [Mycena haematopus]
MEEEVDKKLFVEDGEPLRFYLHKSIRQQGARLALEHKIESYGGKINATDTGSNTILVNPDHPSGDVDKIRHAYKTHTHPELNGVYVEPVTWVKDCIKMGACIHHFIQKGMGGTVGGRERTAFTQEDDDKLAHYLAVLIPNKTAGGRCGKVAYQKLMQNHEVDPVEYDWVQRHTWQSWRERYKKKQEKFDERIKMLGIESAPHQRYHLSRKATRRYMQEAWEEEEEEEKEEEEEEDELEEESSRKRPIAGSRSQRAAKKMRMDSTSPLSPDATQVVRADKGKGKALPEDDK